MKKLLLAMVMVLALGGLTMAQTSPVAKTGVKKEHKMGKKGHHKHHHKHKHAAAVK